MGTQRLSALLWEERELLELLVFKLEEEQLLLTSGKTKWLTHATREVEQVLERLRAADLGRAVAVAGLAAEWGTSEDATLRELVAAAPAGPWTEIFNAHLQAMTELTVKIRELRDINEQFLRTAARSAQETLAGLNPEANTYTASGTSATPMSAARLVDQSI
ncbi:MULTISPECIES: flagellar protein FlgN [unclassified Arthrobacter]|uniref:flagellar protein FlgN n=1 Tax=unclassified Arthrobacter TaxID=235627 RepID=UPI001E5539B3|nr:MULTISPECIES: flagellar protein FlgN [unclassified Arthrobacter]MCC9146685.1 flagellar protein FlgN [Arthrobacter sp. zg-Y919]MDK1277915.1 flagellar protein FlgN [Arthrobacter sp. zg.Y919]MDM7991676.1 flagellar protein FlgN [Arthrobacter sp. zg-Y877]WIB03491.1 flagellar protein FlgN [Arthrobacter sp. zg-Y919]